MKTVPTFFDRLDHAVFNAVYSRSLVLCRLPHRRRACGMNLADARTLWHLARGMPRAADHRRRLAAFYGPQADAYDGFRERLLPGRTELLEWLAPKPGERVVELGAGTGRNPFFLGSRVRELGELTLIDLCAPLLEKARQRWEAAANVRVIEADACTWQPGMAVDVVYFSYALTVPYYLFLGVKK